MTISIVVDSDGIVQTIYNGPREGSEWIQLDRNLPQVGQANVAVTWYYDGDGLSFETEPISEERVVN